ncbi:MAG: hypothetical protein ACK4GR_02855 [bacterium]
MKKIIITLALSLLVAASGGLISKDCPDCPDDGFVISKDCPNCPDDGFIISKDCPDCPDDGKTA